jgi:hypothetical protein
VAGAVKIKLTPKDKLWRDLVKERDGYACRRCHKVYPPPNRGLDAHHIFGRGRLATRHMLLNGVSLCVGHHISWAHANPLEFHEWIREEIGAEEYDELRLLSNQTRVKT